VFRALFTHHHGAHNCAKQLLTFPSPACSRTAGNSIKYIRSKASCALKRVNGAGGSSGDVHDVAWPDKNWNMFITFKISLIVAELSDSRGNLCGIMFRDFENSEPQRKPLKYQPHRSVFTLGACTNPQVHTVTSPCSLHYVTFFVVLLCNVI